jgi:hypothetical protein
MKNTIVGVDLAKDVIQVCVYANRKVQSNTEMANHEFLEWLFTTSETTVVLRPVAPPITGNRKLWRPDMRLT